MDTALVDQSQRPLKILHLASSERWTGVAEPVTSLAVQQQKMGHQVWLACVPGQSFERKARQRGLHVLAQFHLNRRLNPLHLLSDYRWLRRCCRQLGIDIVHTHLLHDHWLAAGSLKNFCSLGFGPKPLLIRTVHTSAPLRTDWLHRKLWLQYSDKIVCVSRSAARRAEEALALPKGAIESIGGGVDLGRFLPGLDGAALREELKIPPDAPVAGIVARMRAGRGFRWLMRAMPLVLEKLPEARLIAVGRGELKKWFKHELTYPEYKGRVIYAGYRGRDLPAAYAAMDVSLFLGLGSEGSCRAILEAMASGKPTIGLNRGAVPEIISDGNTGFLVKHRDVKDLAEKMVSLLADRGRAAAMGNEARRRAEELYSESARAHAVEAIYRKVLESRPQCKSATELQGTTDDCR